MTAIVTKMADGAGLSAAAEEVGLTPHRAGRLVEDLREKLADVG